MNLGGKRLEYLLYLNKQKLTVTQNMIAMRFGVSKVTAHKVLCGMEKMGLVNKGGHGQSVTMTKKGREVAEQYTETLDALHAWMHDMLGLSEIEAETQSLNMLANQSEALVSRIISSALLRRAVFSAGATAAPLAAFPTGVYPISFSVLKKDFRTQSMGDRAFRKPAELAVEQGRGAIFLRSREIRHKSIVGRLMRGSLKRLWFQLDGAWELAKQEADGRWVIPLEGIKVKGEGEQTYGYVCIRAEPTCNFPLMAEHPAYLKFDLAQLAQDDHKNGKNDEKEDSECEWLSVANL